MNSAIHINVPLNVFHEISFVKSCHAIYLQGECHILINGSQEPSCQKIVPDMEWRMLMMRFLRRLHPYMVMLVNMWRRSKTTSIGCCLHRLVGYFIYNMITTYDLMLGDL